MIMQKQFECLCRSPEHTFTFVQDGEDIFLSVHLSKKPFAKRLMDAIRYIFGHTSIYGCFDEVLLSHADVEGLKQFLILAQWARLEK